MTDVYMVLLPLTLISSNHFNSVCNSSLTPFSCRLCITEWLINRANNRKNSFDVDGYSLTTFCSGRGHNDTPTQTTPITTPTSRASNRNPTVSNNTSLVVVQHLVIQLNSWSWADTLTNLGGGAGGVVTYMHIDITNSSLYIIYMD